MPVPAFITEGVAVRTAAREVEKKPVAVRALATPFLHIPERPEVPPDVMEHRVEHDPDTPLVTRRDEPAQVVVRPEPPVGGAQVGGVVTVCARLEHRPEQKRVHPEVSQIRQPSVQFIQPTARRAYKVVAGRRSGAAEREEVVKNGVVCPMVHRFSYT